MCSVHIYVHVAPPAAAYRMVPYGTTIPVWTFLCFLHYWPRARRVRYNQNNSIIHLHSNASFLHARFLHFDKF